MAAKFFTGLPLDGPDPECVLGHGEHALDALGEVETPRPSPDHSSRPRKVPVTLTLGSPLTAAGSDAHLGAGLAGAIVTPARPPDRQCDESPLAGAALGLQTD